MIHKPRMRVWYTLVVDVEGIEEFHDITISQIVRLFDRYDVPRSEYRMSNQVKVHFARECEMEDFQHALNEIFNREDLLENTP